MAIVAVATAGLLDAIIMTYSAFGVKILGLCYPSNLLFEYSASTLATACRARVDLQPDYIMRINGAFATRSFQITLRTCYRSDTLPAAQPTASKH